jgi:DNA-binding transcriptional LysR family regulator
MQRLTLCGNANSLGTDMQKFTSDFDWDHARVFLAVAREGQLLAAARKLKLDQATVTRRINALETALGVRLLDRRTTGSELTVAGRAFLEHAAKIETEFLNLKTALTPDADAIEGTVRIGAPDGFGTLFLASRFTPLLTEHPRLAVQLVPLPRSFSLSKREADIAITVERPVEGRLRVRKLADYSLSLFANAAYLASAPPLKTKADLANHRLISYVSDLLFAATLDFSAELGLTAAPQFQCASVLGQIEAVQSGLGIGLLHDYAMDRYGGLERVLPGIVVRRTYWIVTHAHVEHARPVRTVQDYIVATVSAALPMFDQTRTKRQLSL